MHSAAVQQFYFIFATLRTNDESRWPGRAFFPFGFPTSCRHVLCISGKSGCKIAVAAGITTTHHNNPRGGQQQEQGRLCSRRTPAQWGRKVEVKAHQAALFVGTLGFCMTKGNQCWFNGSDRAELLPEWLQCNRLEERAAEWTLKKRNRHSGDFRVARRIGSP